MKYLLLIHQGTTPLPGTPEWERLSEDEQKAVYADYQAINQTPGVTPGLWLEPPELATTVRVQDGKTLTTDGPFVAVKEALGGYLVFEADDHGWRPPGVTARSTASAAIARSRRRRGCSTCRKREGTTWSTRRSRTSGSSSSSPAAIRPSRSTPRSP